MVKRLAGARWRKGTVAGRRRGFTRAWLLRFPRGHKAGGRNSQIYGHALERRLFSPRPTQQQLSRVDDAAGFILSCDVTIVTT